MLFPRWNFSISTALYLSSPYPHPLFLLFLCLPPPSFLFLSFSLHFPHSFSVTLSSSLLVFPNPPLILLTLFVLPFSRSPISIIFLNLRWYNGKKHNLQLCMVLDGHDGERAVDFARMYLAGEENVDRTRGMFNILTFPFQPIICL